MEITFKTRYEQKFTIFLYGTEWVEDIIFEVGNRIGKENLYRLIYAGKLLKEGTLVKDYNMSPKLPIIVMVTMPSQQSADNASIEKVEMITMNK